MEFAWIKELIPITQYQRLDFYDKTEHPPTHNKINPKTPTSPPTIIFAGCAGGGKNCTCSSMPPQPKNQMDEVYRRFFMAPLATTF